MSLFFSPRNSIKWLLICLVATVAILTACGSDSTSGSGENSGAQADLSAATFDELPNCSINREGNVAYVEAEDANYVCVGKHWIFQEPPMDSVSTEDDLPACVAKREGDSLFVKSDEVAYVCTEGKWEATASTKMKSYETEDNLSNCSEKREGESALVEKDSTVSVCTGGAWVNLGTAVANEDALQNCTAKREGSKVYAVESARSLVCTSGKWVDASSIAATSSSTRDDVTGSSSSFVIVSSSSVKQSSSSTAKYSSSSVKSSSSKAVSSSSAAKSSSSVATSSSSSAKQSSSSSDVTATYDCGSASSCWVLNLSSNSQMTFDIASGVSKVADYYVEGLDGSWVQTNGSALKDCPGWQNLPGGGICRFVVNNWSTYVSKEGMSLQGFGSKGVYGSIYVMDMWGKTSWSVTLEEVYELPTEIFNCEKLKTPPKFTSSVTGPLIPYIEAMTATCPNVSGGSSLSACVYASDYLQAKSLYPNWF